MIPRKEEKRLHVLDGKLLARFEKLYPQSKRVTQWQNPQLAAFVKTHGIGGNAFKQLSTLVERKGFFDIRIERHRWVDCDGSRYTHTLARAAVTDMWPMGTHYWVRDNAIIAGRLLQMPSATQRAIGKKLLLSSLNFMSSCAQLERFERVIRATSRAYHKDPMNWPYIFAGISNNLSSQSREGWAHKQDAWQILAWHVLNALELGVIRNAELSLKNRKFLGLLVPFLAKVSFWKCENSGSWEEIPAVRSSVRAWDHRLVVRLGELSRAKEFQFLRSEFVKQRRYLSVRFKALELVAAVAIIDREATKAMVRDLPFESPAYAKKDLRYRKADAALLYLLELNYPEFLAARAGKDRAWAAKLERAILKQVFSLQDDRSGAIYRYANDSYQKSGFFRNVTVARLNALYGAPSGDASKHFGGRGRILPRGRNAAWTHFVWQIASWSGLQYLKTKRGEYLQMHEKFFLQGLKLVTGSSKSLDVDSKGRVRIISIPAWKMPECYIADKLSTGSEIVFPSPHTPLNWATGEMLYAFEVRRRVLTVKE